MKPAQIFMMILTLIAGISVSCLGVYCLFNAQIFTGIICLLIGLAAILFFSLKDIKKL